MTTCCSLRRLLSRAILLTCLIPSPAHAATLNVPLQFNNISGAISAAQPGDTILVNDGVYEGSANTDLDFGGKAIVLRSVHGAANTIIDCQGSSAFPHRGFYFHNGETSAATVDGFTVRNGLIPDSYAGASNSGGAIAIVASSPTITNCSFIGNTAYSGGAIEVFGNSSPAIVNCAFNENTATAYGGALNSDGSKPSVTNCVITNNSAQRGGGIEVSDNSKATVTDCAFNGDAASNGGGGGVDSNYSSIFVMNSCFFNNQAYNGAGLYNGTYSSSSVFNCTFEGNVASYRYGAGAVDGGGSLAVTNCILWNDGGREVSAPVITFCDVYGGSPVSGIGDINIDPQFVNAATGDLHLIPNSHCLGAGTINGAPVTDRDGRTRPNPPSIGAYEVTSVLNVPSQYSTIQAAINAAAPDDTVLVGDGTYTGPGNVDVDFLGKNLTLKSQHGAASTIIDCQASSSSPHRGIYIHSSETAVRIDGFTVENGYVPYNSSIPYGGGICINLSSGSATITNCNINDNNANFGGGLFVQGLNSVTISNCNASYNTALNAGGGISINSSFTSTVSNCIFVDNKADNGGGIYDYNSSSAIVTHCTAIGNTGEEFGSGIYCESYINNSSIFVTDCTASGNKGSNWGGGIFVASGSNVGANAIVADCASFGNSAVDGGGIYVYTTGVATASVTNCTTSGNTASDSGSGVYIRSTTGYNAVTITNCILWNDLGTEFLNNGCSNLTLMSSDVQGGIPTFVADGSLNISADPKFVRNPNLTVTTPDYGDLHLQPGSPCLGAGADQANAPAGVAIPTTDLDGNTRPDPPSMGAYDSAVPATLTGFTLSPNLISAPGPTVTVAADVSVSGTFSKVTVSPAPGTLGLVSPTFTLANNGTDWTGTISTAYLKLAKTNPVTFIAMGTRSDGSTVQMSAPLAVGALPTLSLAVNSDKSNVPAGMTFSVKGVVQNLAATAASPVTVTIPVPSHLTFVSSPDFQYNVATNAATWTGTLSPTFGAHTISVEFQASANTPANTTININVIATAPGFQPNTQSPGLVVDAPPVPVGIDIQTSGAHGFVDGMAIITSNVGTAPLQATISPVSGVLTIWLGVDYADAANGGPLEPTPGLDVGSLAASLGVVGPGVSPTYAASFPRIGSQCNIGLRLTNTAAFLSVDTIALTFLGSFVGEEDIPENALQFYSEFQTITAFQDAATLLTSPSQNLFEESIQAASVLAELIGMSDDDVSKLASILGEVSGKAVDAAVVKGALKTFSTSKAIVDIVDIIADEAIFAAETGGADAEITFTGSAVTYPAELR